MKNRLFTCWHVDPLRRHVENRCRACHARDCFLCRQAAELGLTQGTPA